MSSPIELPPPAGWYPESADPAVERWWSGIAWTEHCREAPIEPPGSAAAEQEEAAVETAVPVTTLPLAAASSTAPITVSRKRQRARSDVVKGHWGAGSIVSIILALVMFIVLAVWLSPWWLLLPVVVFLVRWLTIDRRQLLRAIEAAPADPVQHAPIIEHVRSSAAKMGIAAPEVYVSPHPVNNAFALTDRHGPLVCVYRGTIDTLEDDELAAVLAHEVGHIKNRDSLYAAFFDSVRTSLSVLFFVMAAIMVIAAAFMSRGRSGVLGGLIGSAVMLLGSAVAFLLLNAGQRSREYGADRLCAETHPDPLALGRALTKLHESDRQAAFGEIPVTVAARCIVAPYASGFVSEIVASHPSPEKRIARIEKLLGEERVAQSRRDAKATAWEREASLRRSAVELAQFAQPTALPNGMPFTPASAESLWIECAGRLASPKSIKGERGLHIGERGRLIVTTERAVFVGTTGKIEWRWSKLHDVSWVGGIDRGQILLMGVENRQRNSGVWMERSVSAQLHPLLDVALAEHRGGRASLIAQLEAAVTAHETRRPVQSPDPRTAVGPVEAQPRHPSSLTTLDT